MDIHFDDLKITHTKSNVIQYNEYYPFGLQTSSSWTRENTKDNNYLYNAANELNKTSGWYEMFYRGYDPAIGRMLQVDPYATMYASHTTYNYAVNNPVMLNDPSGGYVYANAAEDRINKIRDRNNPNYFSDWVESFRTDRMQMLYDTDQVSMGNMSQDAFLDRYATSYRDQATISALARQWRNGDAVLFQFNSQGKVSKVQYIDLEMEYIGKRGPIYASAKEEPINIVAKEGNNAINGVANHWKYKVGDGKFVVFAHGGPGFMVNQLSGEPAISTASRFNKMMSRLSSNWDEAKNKTETSLTLLSCQSATISINGCSVAQMISQAYPNITVIGADGFVVFQQSMFGGFQIIGIDVHLGSGKNDGYLVGYKNGVELYREHY